MEPCAGVLGDIYGDSFVDNLMPSVQIKAKLYIFKKNIKERCLVEFMGCFVLVG